MGHGRRGIAGALAAGLWLLAAACNRVDAVEDGHEETGSAGAVLLGRLMTEPYCSRVGVIEVELRAYRVGCAGGPCTLPAEPPPVRGDRFTCPATSPDLLLGVEIEAAGAWVMEAVARFTTGEEEPDCFVNPADGTREVLVSGAELAAGAQIMLDAGRGPCPGV